jgi:hypothetical protein
MTEGVSPDIGMNDVDPLEYSRHIEHVHHLRDEAGLQVDHKDGGLELNNEHEGIEVAGLSDQYHRPSLPVSAETELPSRRISHDGEDAPPLIPRTCGMKRNRFWILGVSALLIIIGGLIGGLVGGLVTRNTSPTILASSSSPFANLAAVNWTTAGVKAPASTLLLVT